jgi:ATP-dependent protease ClpP protease subunit
MKHLLVIVSLLVTTTFNQTPVEINIEAHKQFTASSNWKFLKPIVRKLAQVTGPAAQQYIPPKLSANEHHIGLIKFNTDVNNDSVLLTSDMIQQMNDAGAEGIVIVINSPGGSVSAGTRLAQAIEESKAPVICVVDSVAASMASFILESCKVRLMTKRASILIHEPSVSGWSLDGGQKDLKNAYEQMHALAEMMLNQYARRSKLTVDEIRKHIENGQDWWLLWQEALNDGFIDGTIINPTTLYKSLVKTGKVLVDRA